MTTESYRNRTRSNFNLQTYDLHLRWNDKEKLDWFKTINITGARLTNQELRNPIYTGEWFTEVKKYFSKTGCAASQIADKYLNGSAIRQDYLETALSWICNRDSIEVEDYMAKHQQDTNCNELLLYFKSIIDWVQVIFPHYRKEMRGRDWGVFFNKYGGNPYDAKIFESNYGR